MNDENYYATLGVLPGAEDVVIRAAYRALSQRYHPDRWTGDARDAHRRMSEINVAYATLGDPVKRAEYDKSQADRVDKSRYSQGKTEDINDAFAFALNEVEDRWEIACSIYPDLVALRENLALISTSLAFSFVIQCLESKAFGDRAVIAKQMERIFFQCHFGDNEAIAIYARELIVDGHKEAAMWLNRLVDVMGPDVDPVSLIRQVDEKFGLIPIRSASRAAKELQAAISAKTANALDGSYYDAERLAILLGYQVKEVGGGFFKAAQIEVKSADGKTLRFARAEDFLRWVQQELC
jgi:curved DNA-binding protein CbpA